jgi:ribonuclease P protein component
MGGKHHLRHFLVFLAQRERVAVTCARGGPAAEEVDALPRVLPTRLGITVTRKVGKAHQRNVVKRRLREAFRRHRHALPEGLDVVFIAKRTAVTASYADVVRDLTNLQRKALAEARRSSSPPAGEAAPRASDRQAQRGGE